MLVSRATKHNPLNPTRSEPLQLLCDTPNPVYRSGKILPYLKAYIPTPQPSCVVEYGVS